MGKEARRIYDTPNKGILWGWEVSGYVLTKAISAGAFLVPFLAMLFGWANVSEEMQWWSFGLALVFLAATGILLIMDLDQPTRFAYVLLRPHWGSWLVKGGYSITVFGGLVTLLGVALFFGWDFLNPVVNWLTAIVAVVVAVYTAFLFAQAKGRDFWQSPTLALHMLVHSLMAGAAAFTIVNLFLETSTNWQTYLSYLLYGAIGFNLLTMLFELTTTHPTEDAKHTVNMILKGRYSTQFFGGAILVGNILPVALLLFANGNPMLMAAAGVLVLAGIYFTEKIWVEAPQRIPLT
jgi:formate-dependent nitrite reductase membrane component NrfD